MCFLVLFWLVFPITHRYSFLLCYKLHVKTVGFYVLYKFSDTEDENVSEPQVFMSALCEEECLRDNNKYWCDHCFHHNEARRSVHYSQLPHHLVIHVKRFSSYHRWGELGECKQEDAQLAHRLCYF